MAEMKVREFLRQVPELLRMQLPGDLREFEFMGPWGGLVKIHYGDPSVHYEVWVQRRNRQVELGLHFEGDADSNRRHLKSLSRRFAEIREALGSEVEPEEWTRKWTRVHESVPLDALDEELLMEVTSRIALYIKVLEPMLGQAGC